MRRLRPVDWTFAGLAVALGALCVWLGFWQLDRLEERRARNASLQAALDRPVADLNAAAVQEADLSYRRLRAVGVFDPAHEIVLSNRSYSGQAGVHLVTPLRLEGSAASVLVDRGWIPAGQAGPEKRATLAIPGAVEVVGIGRPSQSEPSIALLADPTLAPGSGRLDAWRFLNVPAIQAQTPYPLLPIILEATEPVAGMSPPKPQTEIDLSEGSHLSYAIQWFAFAATAFLGGAAWLIRRAGPRAPRSDA